MKLIIEKIKKFIPDKFKTKLLLQFLGDRKLIQTYSQSGEDLLLKKYFNRKIWSNHKGFYVDIGAYDPIKYSNTQLFYQYGWNGINIDATPGSMKQFNKLRKRDINLEFAVGSDNQAKTYYISNYFQNINTFSRDFLKQNDLENKINNKIKLKTKRLSSILDKYLEVNQSIDFMTIDVEGMEESVLKSNNWEKYRPRILVVEIPGINFLEAINHPISQYILENKYFPFDKTILYGENNIGSVFFHDELKEFYPKL